MDACAGRQQPFPLYWIARQPGIGECHDPVAAEDVPCSTGNSGVFMTAPQSIWGTTVFDGQQAMKGYALNKMCYSFNDAANRAASSSPLG